MRCTTRIARFPAPQPDIAEGQPSARGSADKGRGDARAWWIAWSAVPAFQTSPGMRDILPPDSARWRRLNGVFADVVESAGYGQIITPLIEDVGVFTRIGEATEVGRRHGRDGPRSADERDQFVLVGRHRVDARQLAEDGVLLAHDTHSRAPATA